MRCHRITPSLEVGQFQITGERVRLYDPKLVMSAVFPLEIGRALSENECNLTQGFSSEATIRDYTPVFESNPMYNHDLSRLVVSSGERSEEYMSEIQTALILNDTVVGPATFLVVQKSDACPTVIYRNGLLDKIHSRSGESYDFEVSPNTGDDLGIKYIHLLFGCTQGGSGEYVKFNTGAKGSDYVEPIHIMPLMDKGIFNPIQ